ncbi:MAG: zf-HC2 domain-containing protein [Acidobacteriota bacterium]
MKAANRTSGNHEDQHLGEERMIAYCLGEMSAVEHEAAEAHLVGCEQCIALFRNARDFLEPARTNEEEVTATETNEAWRSLLERVQVEASTSTRSRETTVVTGDFHRPRDKKFLSRVTLALAASLLISFGALGWLTWRYRQERESRRQSQEAAMQLESRQRELEQRLAQVEQSGGDQLKRERDQRLAAETKRDQLQAQLAAAQQAWQNVPVYTARLSSERGAEDDLRLHFTTAAQAMLLRLFINKPYEFPEYAIELFDQRAEMVREISGLRPTGDDGALSFRLDRATLSAGKYRLRLFGQRGKEKKQLGEYGLSVTVGR